MTARAAKPLTGRQVLMLLLAFFGVVLGVNGVFIFYAISTFSGQTSPNPYAEGLRYNQRIALADSQSIAGLRHQTSLGGGEVRISFTGDANHSVNRLIVKARLARPASDRDDLNLALSERATGDYGATVALSPGAWILEVTAQRESAGPAIYQAKERLWLTPKP